MNYVILAAGSGSRMGSLSSYLQKCMYPILDKPFLEYTLDSIRDSEAFRVGRDRLIFVVGHKAEQIHAYFGEAWSGVPISYAFQAEPLGTAHALLLGRAAGEPDEPCLVIQADVWADPDYLRAVAAHPAENLLSAHRHECGRRHDERLDLDGDRVVRAFGGSGPYVECGVWKMGPALVDFMMSRKADEYRALISVQAAIEAGLEVKAFEREEWIHLGGTEPDLRSNLAALYRRALLREGL